MRIKTFLAATALTATSAHAQQSHDVPLTPGTPYRHTPTGLVLPSALDGLTRSRFTVLVKDLDEFTNFEAPDHSEDLTVYVFRHVTGSVPVWFDRGVAAIEQRAIYQHPTAVLPAAAFVPPRQKQSSGLIVTYRAGGGPYKSTALAYVPLGAEWFVVFRYSSATLEPAALNSHLRAAMAALQWPNTTETSVALPIGVCPTPLAISGEAKPVAGANAGAMVLAATLMNASAPDKSGKKEPAFPALWCRDTGHYAGLEAHGVYRPTGSQDSYLIAFGDAGRGALVAKDSLAALLNRDKAAPPTWAVSFVDLASTSTFLPRDRLPPPDQAFKIMTTEHFAGRVNTWGDKKNIETNSDSLKSK